MGNKEDTAHLLTLRCVRYRVKADSTGREEGSLGRKGDTYIHIYTHTHTHTYICIIMADSHCCVAEASTTS